MVKRADERHHLNGIVSAVLTPTLRHRVDLDTMDAYLRWLLDRGATSIFLLGTTGEGLLVPEEDWKVTVETATKAVGKRVPIVVQCGAIGFTQTIQHIEHAVAFGADAVALQTPYFYSYSLAELECYYRELLSASVGVSVYLYNIPKYAGNQITPQIFAELSQTYPNVLGLKDSSGQVEPLKAFKKAVPCGALFSGSDALLEETYRIQCRGVVSGIAAVFPKAVQEAWEQLHVGDSTGSDKIRAVRNVFHRYGTIRAARAVLDVLGMRVGNPFSPMSPIPVDEYKTLVGLLRTCDPQLLPQIIDL